METAWQDGNYVPLERTRYDGLFVLGLTVLFIVMLFMPFIAQNPLTMRLLELIYWAYNLRVIGWILRIGGALFLLAYVVQGAILSVILIGSVVGELRSGTGEPNWFQRHVNLTWLFAYLIWIPLNASANTAAQVTGAILLLFASGWVIKQKGRALWWILLTPVFSPLWLRNKKTLTAQTQREERLLSGPEPECQDSEGRIS